jgi:uncharacterized protein (DUF488 family)
MKIFTIGYGGRNCEDFLDLIKSHGIRCVVDIRLRPDRASMGIWMKAKTNDRGIQKWLADAGIDYRSLIELGNVFLDQPDWMEQYQSLMDQSGELLTRRLKDVASPYCLMCAERRVEDCHRRIVAEHLMKHQHATIEHLQ